MVSGRLKMKSPTVQGSETQVMLVPTKSNILYLRQVWQGKSTPKNNNHTPALFVQNLSRKDLR
jgi:hypothetical protein